MHQIELLDTLVYRVTVLQHVENIIWITLDTINTIAQSLKIQETESNAARQANYVLRGYLSITPKRVETILIPRPRWTTCYSKRELARQCNLVYGRRHSMANNALSLRSNLAVLLGVVASVELRHYDVPFGIRQN